MIRQTQISHKSKSGEWHLENIRWACSLTVQWGLTPSQPQQKDLELPNYALLCQNIAKIFIHSSLCLSSELWFSYCHVRKENLLAKHGIFGLVGFYGTSTIVGYLMRNPFLYILTVLFQTIQFSISTQFSSIWSIDRTLSGATTPDQSGPRNDGNKEVLCIPQSSNISGTSLSDCLVSYPRHSAGMQSVYSTAPADWATWHFSLTIQ